MIPQSFIDDLLYRLDIADVVGRYVQLKAAGANLQGLCPFHNEKSPSFTVSPSKQFYHCFGCGAHGNAVGFVMEHLGLTFPEAVENLAGNLGIDVPYEKGMDVPAEVRSEREELVELLTRAANYYKAQLKKSQVAIDYLKNRGLTGQVAARYGMGYAPDAYQNLEAVVENYASNTQLDLAGLTKISDSNRRYDAFRGRIMFPIRNAKGQVIGFGGRVLGDEKPKYLNSPETPVFSKGHEVYGLFEARQAIHKMGYALVTEGYMDVVALAQWGFENAVATLGTAVTPDHVLKLFKQTTGWFLPLMAMGLVKRRPGEPCRLVCHTSARTSGQISFFCQPSMILTLLFELKGQMVSRPWWLRPPPCLNFWCATWSATTPCSKLKAARLPFHS